MWLFLGITTLLRLIQLPSMELAPDEAYYWDWSRRLDWGYYDQGPFVAYILYFTTKLFGITELGVRIGVLVASLGTLVCCGVLARRVFSERAAFFAVLLLGMTPLMEVGSIIATYDPFMVLFWAITLLLLERALFSPDAEQQRKAWLWAGVTTGLGFLSKHTMLLILPCLVLFLLLSPAHRPWLRRPLPYLAFGVCLLLYGGVFYWNSQHHWWTFGHLFFLAKKDFGVPIKRFGDFIGSQALLLGPVLFFATLSACRFRGKDSTSGGNKQEYSPNIADNTSLSAETTHYWRLRFLVCCGLPILLLFSLMTLKAKVQGNWAPCAWLTLTVLWAGWLAGLQDQARAWRWITASVLTSLFVTVVILSPALRLRMGIRIPPQDDLSNQVYGWRETATRVQQVRDEMNALGKPAFIATNSYQYSGLMAFYLPDHPQTFKLYLHTRLSMYAAHIEDLKAHLGENAIYVNDNEVEDGYLREIFERVEWDTPMPIWRYAYSKEPVRTLHIARCYGFKRYIGLEWAEGG